jgi:hypothetical protein
MHQRITTFPCREEHDNSFAALSDIATHGIEEHGTMHVDSTPTPDTSKQPPPNFSTPLPKTREPSSMVRETEERERASTVGSEELEEAVDVQEGEWAHIASYKVLIFCIKHPMSFEPIQKQYEFLHPDAYPTEIAAAFKHKFKEEITMDTQYNKTLDLNYLIIDMSASMTLLDELVKFKSGNGWNDHITWTFEDTKGDPKYSVQAWIMKMDPEEGFMEKNMAINFGLTEAFAHGTEKEEGFWVDVMNVPGAYIRRNPYPISQDVYDTYNGLARLNQLLKDSLQFSEDGKVVDMELQTKNSKPRPNFARVKMKGALTPTLPHKSQTDVAGEALMTTISTNTFRFWFKKSLMKRRAVAFGSFPTTIDLKFTITHPVMGKMSKIEKVEIRYKTEALGTVNTKDLQDNIKNEIQLLNVDSTLQPTHVLFICNRYNSTANVNLVTQPPPTCRCKSITHPYIGCQMNPAMQDRLKRRKMHQAGLDSAKKKQEEMMAKAMADAQAAEDEADEALTDFKP